MLYENDNTTVELRDEIVIYQNSEDGERYTLQRKDVKKLATEGKIDEITATMLLGTIKEIERQTSSIKEGAWIGNRRKIATLQEVLQFIEPIILLSILKDDFKFYELEQLCEADNPVQVLKEYLEI